MDKTIKLLLELAWSNGYTSHQQVMMDENPLDHEELRAQDIENIMESWSKVKPYAMEVENAKEKA